MTVRPNVHVYDCNLCGFVAYVPAIGNRRAQPEGWAEVLARGDNSFKHLCRDCLRAIDFARADGG